MKKVITVLLLIWSLTNISAQNQINTFELVVPVSSTISNSLYNSIEFQDNRPDSEYESVKIDGQLFADRLDTILRMSTDNSAGSSRLFFKLANLNFEKTNNTLESHLVINLYDEVNSEFYLFNTLDTTITITVPDLYKETVSNAIANFLIDNLIQGFMRFSTQTPHSSESSTKLYNTDLYTNGIYTTFQEFVDQTPSEYKITAKFKKEKLKEVKVMDTQTNKLKKVNPKDIYAVIIENQPYIATDKKFIPLYKENGEFYFEDSESKNRLSFSPSFSIGIGSGGYSGGGLGIGIFSQPDKRRVLFMINHKDGSFIKIE